MNDDGRFRQRAWYFSKIYADPKVAGHGLRSEYRRVPLGRWRQDVFICFPRVMAIITGFWIDPKNPRANRRMRTTAAPAFRPMAARRGRRWIISRPRSSITSRWTTRFPYHIYGAQQDNSNVCIASRTDEGVIGTRRIGIQAGGGECGFVFPDPRDWHIIYSNNEGYLTRYDKTKRAMSRHQRLADR